MRYVAIALTVLLMGCSQNPTTKVSIKKTDVASVTVVDLSNKGVVTYTSTNDSKVWIQSDGSWLKVSVRTKSGVKKITHTHHYRAESLLKYTTKD